MFSIQTTLHRVHDPARRHALRLALATGLTLSMAAAAPAQDSGHGVTVREQVELGVPPARAWSVIQNYLAWPAWHPAFASTQLLRGDGHSQGSVRLLIAKDGAQFTEELVAFDAARRRLQYRILESPAPVIGYVSTLEVKPSKSGSTVVWSSSFQVKAGTTEAEAKQAITGIYRLGLDNLAASFD